MAVTILHTPADYSSVHDDLIYTVSEPVKTADPVTYPNYKFIADVYVSGVQVARIKKVQDPVTGIGIFNVGQVVRNYMQTIFDPTLGTLVCQIMGASIHNLGVQVKFGEEYSFTSYYNITNDTPRTFFNNYNGRLVGTTSSLEQLVNKIVSNRPPQSKVLSSSVYCFLSYFPSTTAPIQIKITPNNGAQYSTTYMPANALNLLIFNIAPQNLNSVHPGLINAGTSFYTVQIGVLIYRFNIICEAIYRPYTLHFLNKYGGFDTKIFSKVSRTTYNMERKDYGRQPYNVGNDGIPTYRSANKVYNESRAVYSVQYSEKMVLNSDLLTDAEYIWLEDLVFSPMVYMEDSGYFFPVAMKETDYEPKKNVNDDLTSLTINIEYGQQLNAQFR
jgi:hypothetical protein